MPTRSTLKEMWGRGRNRISPPVRPYSVRSAQTLRYDLRGGIDSTSRSRRSVTQGCRCRPNSYPFCIRKVYPDDEHLGKPIAAALRRRGEWNPTQDLLDHRSVLNRRRGYGVSDQNAAARGSNAGRSGTHHRTCGSPRNQVSWRFASRRVACAIRATAVGKSQRPRTYSPISA